MGKSINRADLEKLVARSMGYKMPKDPGIYVSSADEIPPDIESALESEYTGSHLEKLGSEINPYMRLGDQFIWNKNFKMAISSYYKFLASSSGSKEMSAAIMLIYVAHTFDRFIDSVGNEEKLIKSIKKINDTVDDLYRKELINAKDREWIFRVSDYIDDSIQRTGTRVSNLIEPAQGP